MPVNYRLTARELSEILLHAEPQLFIVATEYLEQATDVQKLLPDLNTLWQIDGDSSTNIDLYENMLRDASTSAVYSPVGEKDCFAYFLYQWHDRTAKRRNGLPL